MKDAGLVKGNALPLSRNYDSRTVLQAAALMHDVGKAKGQEKHQKKSYRMIRRLERPLGWSAREMEMAAVVARNHSRALPPPRGNRFEVLELPGPPIGMEVGGGVRLAKPAGVLAGRQHHRGRGSPQP